MSHTSPRPSRYVLYRHVTPSSAQRSSSGQEPHHTATITPPVEDVRLWPAVPPHAYTWDGRTWAEVEVSLEAPEEGLDYQVLQIIAPEPLEKAPLQSVQAIVQERINLPHDCLLWYDNLLTVPVPAPEEGDPAPEEGDPAPEEGDPAPEEGDPAPGRLPPTPARYRWSLPIVPSPGRVEPARPFGEQYVFWRTGFVTARERGLRWRGRGVTVFILDTFPYVDGQLDADDSLLDLFVNFVVDETVRPSPVAPAAPEPECPFVERRARSRQPQDDPNRLAFSEVLPYHGLLVASLIRHVAPEARIVGLRVINNHGATFTSDLVRAVNWVLSRPQLNGISLAGDQAIFNLSLSLRRTQKETVESCAMFYAVDTAARRGYWFVCAAGNDSEGRPENPVEPAAYGYYADSSATARRVIAVAGSHKPTAYARFSNEGTVAAPSTGVIMDPGPSRFKQEILRGGYVRWHGTSFATPQVTGLLALLLSRRRPPADPKQHIWERAHLPRRWNGVREICFSRTLMGVSCEAFVRRPRRRRPPQIR
ncbi:MAG: S8/S53 family peptidase [Ardenticatenia bacterium]|nr:S8/S53 family peptidase [Ardenticatenia bacterium]